MEAADAPAAVYAERAQYPGTASTALQHALHDNAGGHTTNGRTRRRGAGRKAYPKRSMLSVFASAPMGGANGSRPSRRPEN